eukprot:12903194-Prorocentrum_lima.AAC.1
MVAEHDQKRARLADPPGQPATRALEHAPLALTGGCSEHSAPTTTVSADGRGEAAPANASVP